MNGAGDACGGGEGGVGPIHLVNPQWVDSRYPNHFYFQINIFFVK